MRRLWISLLLVSAAASQTAQFPTAVVADKDLTVQKDRAQSTLSGALTSSATSMTVITGSKFAANMIVTIDNEQVLVCSVVSNTISVGYSACPNVDGRGYAGTSAASHANGSLVSANAVSWAHNALAAEVKAIELALGANLGTAIPNPLPVNRGGTNAQTAAAARTALGAAASGANSDITSLGALSTPLSTAQGGTGVASPTAHSVPIAEGSSAHTYLAPGTTGYVWTSNGAGADPSYQAVPAVLPSGTQRQYLRIKPNTGNNTTAEFASFTTLSAPDYAYTAITPTGSPSLTGGGGAQSLTLAVCPNGITTSGTYATPVYLSGGTGTAETVFPTGGTCTSGALAGTIIIAPVNNHSGAYTVASATGGLQEALNALPSGNGTVRLDPAQTIILHTKVTFPVGRHTLDGQNFFGQAITRASDYPNGDLLYEASGAITTIKNMWIGNGTIAAQTSGAGIAYAPGTDADLSKVNVLGGYYGYDFNGTSTIDWEMCGFNSAGQVNRAGVWIHDTSGTHTPVNSVFHGGNMTLTDGTWGFLIQAADGAQLNDLRFGSGSIQVYISLGGVPGNYISSIFGTNLFMDNPTQSSVKIDGPAGTITNIHFDSSILQGDGNGLNTYGVDVCYSNSCASNLTNWSVKGSTITGWSRSGIAVGATAVHGRITANAIHDNNINNTGSEGGIKLDVAITQLSIGLNRIYNIGAGGHQKWAVGFLNAGSGVSITNNAVAGNESSAFSISGAITTSIIRNNSGVDDVTPAVASAATLAFPANPNFTITGSTGVTAVTILINGASGTLMPTAAPISFTAGASIGNSYVAPQNRLTHWTFDGTHIWLSGPGAILSSAAATNSTSSIGSTALLTAPVPGLYRVSWTLTTGSVSGGSATSLVTIGWTDAVGAKTSAGGALTLAAAANQSGSTLVNLASGNVTYATTYAAGSGGNYNLTLTAERVF